MDATAKLLQLVPWLLAAGALLLGVAAIAKAAVDILNHQPDNNVFMDRGRWWDVRVSWKNKYQAYDAGDHVTPAFRGSTGPLVWLTDFWHAADAIYLLCYYLAPYVLGLAVGLSATAGSPLLWPSAVLLVLEKTVFGAIFELFYQRLFRKTHVDPPA